MSDIEDREDFELEFVDLPPDRRSKMGGRLTIWETRLQPVVQRERGRRLVMGACTALLVLFLLLTNLPSPRRWLYALVAPPMPTPIAIGATTILPYDAKGRIVIINGNSWQLVPQATFGNTPIELNTPIDTPTTPEPMLVDIACPTSSVQNTSSQIGDGPVWLTGFSGPYARVYLSRSIPVPSFPSLYGFPVPIQVEALATLKDQITLRGQGMSNGIDIQFGYDTSALHGPQTSTITLDQQSQIGHPYTVLINGVETSVWNITMFLPASDCYTLRVSWSDGQLITNFLAGR